jgi:hypothetical protein
MRPRSAWSLTWPGLTQPTFAWQNVPVNELQPKAPRNRGAKLLILGVAVLIGLAIAITYLLTGRSNTITGSLSVIDDVDADIARILRESRPEYGIGQPCDGGDVSSGYGDIRPGAGVTVKNEAGEIIATGSVTEGAWTEGSCDLNFLVEDVPKAEFYQIEVSHRGEQRYAHDDLAAKEFHLELSIGD